MDLLGKTLGNFRIDRLLGEGGMGAVYQAYDLALQRDVAIKRIHPHMARQPAFRERFIQEARLMARLDHPGIVRVYSLGKEGELLFLPMEYIKGGNLRQLLDRLIHERKWLPLPEAVLLVQQLCQVVEYAHTHGVLHRDIKPANLMLKPEPTDGLPFRVVLTDLGLAKLLEGLGLTQEGTSLGTPAYMSPEQALGNPTDARSDVYSLGILLYELAVGRLPFVIRSITEATRYHTQEPPPPPRSIRPELPEAVERVILKALEKEPDKRYPSAAAFGAALSGSLGAATQISEQPDPGTVSLVREYQASVIAPPAPAAASLMTVLGSEAVEPRGASVFGDQSVPPSPETRIQVIPKEQTAKIFTLPSGTVTIGRGKDNHIVLEDEKASRRHAQITWDGLEYHVMDLNSSNGTYLENSKLLPGMSEVLRPNQNLRIGDTWLRLIQPSSKAPSLNATKSMLASSPSFAKSSAGLVGVSVTPQQLAVEPGGIATATVSLLNQSPNVDHFSLSLTGIPSAWVASLPPGIQLMPGEQKEAAFTIQVPRAPQSSAGPHPIKLKVTSERDPSQFVEIKLTLTVAAYSQFRTEIHPQRIRSGQTGHLAISNQGNIQEIFTIQFKDAANELTFQPPQIQMPVPAGAAATAEYRVQEKQRRWIGNEKSHSFSAHVGLPKGEPQTLQGEMLSRGLVPVWLPPIMLLLCCSFTFLVARYAPPLLFPTPTQTLTPIVTATSSPYATPEPGAPVIERWCVYPSNQPPPTDCPIQVNIAAGQTVTIEWSVSNAEQVVITPLGNQAPSDTISSYSISQDTTFTIEATNVAQKKVQKTIQVSVDPPTPTAVTPTLNNTSTPTLTNTSMPTNTPTITPTDTQVPTPVDLHALASSAIWVSSAGNLTFGGPDTDSRGFVMYQNGVRLEDGSNPAKVLEMHPQWVDDGVISGLFPLSTVFAGGHFRAQLGFIARADGLCGDRSVKFQLNYRESGVLSPLGEWVKACDGSLQTIDVDLSSLAGRNVQFALVVLANGSSGQDWAVWVNPRIEY